MKSAISTIKDQIRFATDPKEARGHVNRAIITLMRGLTYTSLGATIGSMFGPAGANIGAFAGTAAAASGTRKMYKEAFTAYRKKKSSPTHKSSAEEGDLEGLLSDLEELKKIAAPYIGDSSDSMSGLQTIIDALKDSLRE